MICIIFGGDTGRKNDRFARQKELAGTEFCIKIRDLIVPGWSLAHFLRIRVLAMLKRKLAGGKASDKPELVLQRKTRCTCSS